MKFYRLSFPPDPSDEGLDLDEWFTSLATAKARRLELLPGAGEDDDSYFSVEQVQMARLPPQQLLLAVLNRRGYVVSSVEVVPPYELS